MINKISRCKSSKNKIKIRLKKFKSINIQNRNYQEYLNYCAEFTKEERDQKEQEFMDYIGVPRQLTIPPKQNWFQKLFN
jgi:hypothetical protein